MLRSGEQYLEALRDGRVVYYGGERVEDVTRHPALSLAAREGAEAMDFKNDPAMRERLTKVVDGEPVRAYHMLPGNREELQEFMENIELGLGSLQFEGTAAMQALSVVAARMDESLGTNYRARCQDYLRLLRVGDLTSSAAVSDVKGDRSKPASEQLDPDLFVRISERRPDGIVIRGAKASITHSPVADELIVLPTHAFGAADRDYAVACAVPVNAPGLKLICNYGGEPSTDSFDRPLWANHGRTDPTVIFEDVFVPNERVFMAGEYQFTRDVARLFGTFLRAGEIASAPEDILRFIGAAQLIAELNGLGQIRHIRDKIGEMVALYQLVTTLRTAALAKVDVVEGVALPDPVATNLLKLHHGEKRLDLVRNLAEIAGGGTLTAPTAADFRNPEIAPLVRKYFQGANGVDGETRVRAFKLVYDLVASESAGYSNVLALFGGGGPAVQRAMLSSAFDMSSALATAKQLAGISDAAKEPASTR